MTYVSRKGLVSSFVAILLIAGQLWAAPAASASGSCEEQTPSEGSFRAEFVSSFALTIEADVEGTITLKCQFEGQVADYIHYEANTDICVPIQGDVEVEALVSPDQVSLYIGINQSPGLDRPIDPTLPPSRPPVHALVLCGEGLDGRMTGGGWTDVSAGRVTMGSSLPCALDDDPSQDQNFQINWGNNSFHLESPRSMACFGADPDFGGGGHHGEGEGRCNGEPAHIQWSLFDGGSETFDDGTSYNYPDWIEIKIDGACELEVEAELYGGQLTLHPR